MDNKSEESVSSEGMLSGGGSRGKWRIVAVLDVCRPANDVIVRLGLQMTVYQQDTQMWLFSKTEITSTHDDDPATRRWRSFHMAIRGSSVPASSVFLVVMVCSIGCPQGSARDGKVLYIGKSSAGLRIGGLVIRPGRELTAPCRAALTVRPEAGRCQGLATRMRRNEEKP